jgi:hypothetical protein
MYSPPDGGRTTCVGTTAAAPDGCDVLPEGDQPRRVVSPLAILSPLAKFHFSVAGKPEDPNRRETKDRKRT